MGKLARIQELESDVAYWRNKATIHDDIVHYLKVLAEMPEDAVLLYTLDGTRIQHEIGLSARILFSKVSANG